MPTIKLDIEVNENGSGLNKFIKKVEQALDGLGAKTTIPNISGLKKSENQVQSFANKSTKAFDGLNKKIKTTVTAGGLLASAFTFNTITDSISKATQALDSFVQPYVELDKQIKNIGTLGVENLDQVQDKLVDLSTRLPETASGLAGAYYQAVSAGIPGSVEEVSSFVEQASKVGVAGLASTEAAVNGLSTVLNAYKLEVGDTAQVSDTFFAAIKLGKTSFNEINAGLANIVPAASAVGVGFEEISGIIAQMTSLGTPTAQATTQMRAALVELQKPAKPLAEALEKAGLSAATMGDTLKNQGLTATLQQLEESASASGQSLTQLFGSSEAASAALLLTGNNAESANAKLKAVNQEIQNGASAAAYEQAADSISVKTQIIANKIQSFFSGVFDTLGSGAVTAVSAVNQVLPSLAGLGGIAAIIPPGAGSAVANFGKQIASTLVPALFSANAATGATKLGFASMWAAALSPVTIILAAIAAVGAALALFFTKTETGRKIWTDFKKTAVEIWDGIINAVDTAFNRLEPVFDAISEVLSKVWDVMKIGIEIAITPLITYFQLLWEGAKLIFEVIGSIVSAVVEFIGITPSATSSIDSIVSFFGNLGETLDTVRFALSGVRSVIQFISSIMVNFVKNLSSPVTAFKKLYEDITNFGSGAVDAFQSGFKAEAVNKAISDAFSTVDETIASMESGLKQQIKDLTSGAEPDFDSAIKAAEAFRDAQIQLLEETNLDLQTREGISDDLRLKAAEEFASRRKAVEEQAALQIATIQKQQLQAQKQADDAKKESQAAAAKTSAQDRQNALDILKAKRSEAEFQIQLANQEEEINRIKAGRKKDVRDELSEQLKLVEAAKDYKAQLEDALEAGSVNGVRIDVDAFNEELEAVKKELTQQEQQTRKIRAEITVSDREIAKEIQNLEIKGLKMDIEAGLADQSSLVDALKAQADDLSKELSNPQLSPVEIRKLENEYRELLNQISQMEAQIADQANQTRIRGIKDAAIREREERLAELDKWLKSELDNFKGSEETKLQITREYNRQRLGILQSSLLTEATLGGTFARINQSLIETLNQDDGSADRVQGIKDEIAALKEKEAALKDQFVAGEIGYNDYISQLSDLDDERATKQEQLAEQIKDTYSKLNEALITAFDQTAQIFEQRMQESIANIAATFAEGTDGMGLKWSNFQDSFGSLAEAGASQAISSFASMVASGKGSLQALGDSVWQTALSMFSTLAATIVPTIVQNAFQNLPIYLAIPAALAAIAATSGLIAAARSQLQGSRRSGGWMESRGLYEVSEEGKEFIFKSTISRKYGKEFERINNGADLYEIANEKMLSNDAILAEQRNAAIQRELQSSRIESKQQHQELIYEIRSLKKDFRHKTTAKVTGSFELTGDKLEAAIRNHKKGFNQ